MTRMFMGINIYHDAMRWYIGQKMRRNIEDDWFRTRVIDIIENPERKEKLQQDLDKYVGTSGMEEGLIQVRDIPNIVSAQKNSGVFSDQFRERELLKQMREIWIWRNKSAHPRMDDFSNRDAANTLDFCACVLRPVDEGAANQVRRILNSRNPQQVLQHVQKQHEETKQEPEAEQDEHKETEKKVKGEDNKLPKIKESQSKFLKARIRNLHKWLNDCLRPPMDGSIPKPPSNMLETCEIMLKVVDEKAAKQVSWPKYQPDALLRLENERLLHGTTLQNLRNTFDEVRRQLVAKHEKTKQELREARQQIEDSKKVKQQVEQPREEMQREFEEADAKLDQARRNLAQAQQQLREVKPSQLQSKPPSAPESKQLKEYRKTFKFARSGNGWTRRTEVEDWLVTRWVGTKLGKDYACVFAPSRGWIEAGEGSLIDQACNSEEEAFAHLQRAEQSGEITRLAREAIQDYESPDSASDDDIPF